MLELFFLKMCLDLMWGNVSLHELPEEKLKKLFLISRPTASIDIKTLDLERKKEIDDVIIAHGLLANLTRVISFQEDIGKLKLLLQDKRSVEDAKIYGNVYLLGVATKNLYDRLESMYFPNVLYMIYENIDKCISGTFSDRVFLHHIESDRIGLSTILGFDPLEEEYENTSFADIVEEDVNELDSLSRSILVRDRISRELASRLIRNYSKEEIECSIKIIVEALLNKDDIVCQETIKLLVRARRYIEEMRTLQDKKNKAKECDPDQCMILGF